MPKLNLLLVLLPIITLAQELPENISLKFNSKVKSVEVTDECDPQNNGTYLFDTQGRLTEELSDDSTGMLSYRTIYHYEGAIAVLVEMYTNGELIEAHYYEYDAGNVVHYEEKVGEMTTLDVLKQYEDGKLKTSVSDYTGEIVSEEYEYQGSTASPGGLITSKTIVSSKGEMKERIIAKDREIIHETFDGRNFRTFKTERYDEKGNLTEIVWPGDEFSEGDKHFFEYDRGMLVHEERFEDGELVAETFYDIYGNIVMESNTSGIITEYENVYNEHGDLSEVHAIVEEEIICSKFYTYQYW